MPEPLTLESLAARIAELQRKADQLFGTSPVADAPVVIVENTESRPQPETE